MSTRSARTSLTAAERMKRAGKTFYLASRLLPKSVREDVVSLYAFCRVVDDLADEASLPLAERQRTLAELQAALDEGSGPALQAAGWPFACTGLISHAAGILIRAALGDLTQTQPQTEEDVLDYAFGVAGTVGMMMANVLQANPGGYEAAMALGMAMQLSNICRDVAEDLSAGRIYLPADLIQPDTLTRAIHLGSAADVSLVVTATRRLLTKADSLYETAWNGIWSLPWRTRWSILAAGLCYRAIGVQVGHDAPRSWKRRTVVSVPRKLWLIAWAGVRLFMPRFWRPQPSRSALALGHVASNKACVLRTTNHA